MSYSSDECPETLQQQKHVKLMMIRDSKSQMLRGLQNKIIPSSTYIRVIKGYITGSVQNFKRQLLLVHGANG